MPPPPYSLQEAKKLCADFQHLVGQPFDQNFSGGIDCVVVAPFAQDDKSRFLMFYLLFEDTSQALAEYHGFHFDVILIAGSFEKNELQQKDIYTWLNQSAPANAVALHSGGKIAGGN